jgi:signal transduction histidine kinase
MRVRVPAPTLVGEMIANLRRRALEITTHHPAALRNAGDAAVGAALAAALTAMATFELETDAWGRVLSAGVGLSLAFWRRFPLGQFVVALGCTIAYQLAGYPAGPIYGVALLSALAMVAGTEPRIAMPAALIGAGLFLSAQVIEEGWSDHLFVAAAVWIVGPLLFGEAMRLRRTRAQFAERTREQEARRQVAEERLRIARDVHDVVGHSLSTIALQAGVAEHLSRDEQAREALTSIRRVSRASLSEVSALLGVLREEHAARAPTPDLGQVPRLVAEVREAGLEVELEIEGNGAVPDVVGVAAYRIVQESLTNVVRHAGAGAHARVRVRAREDEVEVEVSDDGRGKRPDSHDGNGLTGMRERAAALGGRFEAGTAAGGGFRVRALLPAP